ncbi:MAG TPA: SIMPL domain-containing protein [Bryobacteraceae bacterium]|nr:SIMPL domain-containing protein [Bryobacteraceae bacterium]
MAKQRGRAGGLPPARPEAPALASGETTPENVAENIVPEDTKRMSPYGLQGQGQFPQLPREGVTVIGEAVRRVPPESAEFLIEITTSGPTAAHALSESQSRASQIAQALQSMGVQQADLQTVSLNVFNLYAPIMRGLHAGSPTPQIGPGFSPLTPGQPEVQLGSYHARNVLRVNVRQAGRVGEIVDAVSRAGATVAGSFSFQASDEAAARKAVLEAAGRDARSKAEALAAAAGRQIAEPVSITEDCIVSNGAYAILRAAAPYAFGAGGPQVAGELEYYARVSANFRFQ